MSKALIIVDVQNDFCPGGALAVPEGDKVIPVINKVIPFFDDIFYTRDWHPKNHKSFASNNNKNIGEIIDLNGTPQIMWPDHCIQHTEGAKFATGLKTTLTDNIIFKGGNPEIDSYSAFFDNDHKSSTILDELLKIRKIKDLYVVGLATDYCVKFTVLDALKLGYNVTVIEDGIRGVNLNEGDVDKAIEEMKQKGARFISGIDIVGGLE